MAQVSYGTITITDVTDGAMTAIIYLYQRAVTEPQSMPGNLVYNFDDGSLSGTMNNWVQSIEDLGESTNPIWMIAATATATSTNSTDEIASTEWQGPIILAQNGQDGTPGKGISSTTIKYGISSSSTVEPANWVDNVPTLTKGDWLWVRTYYLYTDNSNKTTYTKSYIGTDGKDGSSVVIQSASKSEGVTTIVISDGTTTSTLTINDGEDGDNGTPGAPGADGVPAYVHVAWANSSDGSVDFSTSDSSGKEYLGVYTDNTQADSQINTDYSWSLIKGEDGQDGQDGQDGDPGAPGYNQATIYLYQRADDGLTGPNVPNDNLTYDFSNGTFTSGSIGSWSRSVPTTDNKKPCWITTAVAISQNSSVTIASSAWSTPVKLVEDGADGTNGTNGTNGLSVTALRELYYLETNSTDPSQVTPQTTIYSTDEANKWTTIIPSYSGTGTYYTCVETTLSDSSKVWSAPIVNDGLTTTNANAFTAAQGITLMGGHFIYKGTTSTSGLTIPSANVVECINDNSVDVTNDPTKWKHNVHIGANGIGLRYNEATLSQWNTSGLTFYKPATSGNNVIQGGKAMELTANALNFYGSNQNTPDSYLGANGLVTTKGVIGGWTIDDCSLYSLEKTEWDEDEDGIFIGNHERIVYKLSEDTSIQENKDYYNYDKENAEFNKIENPGIEENPKQNEWYEKIVERIFTLSGGKIQYVKTDDTQVNEEQTYYKLINDEYIKVPASEISEGINPKSNEWYISLGPMWYINSDGSASFGSLLVNQSGSLDVPAASISGKLTADQIEVDNLGAISANIGSTIDSDTTSNTFKADSKIKWIPSNDTKVVDYKDYYQEGNKNSKIDSPTGNPKNNGYYEQIEDSYILLKTSKNNYRLTEDIQILIGKKYYYYDINYELSKDIEVDSNKTYYKAVATDSGDDSIIEYSPVVSGSGDNPKDNQWYEKQSEYILANGNFTPTKDSSPQQGKKYYEYKEKNGIIDYYEVINPSGNLKYKKYYEEVTNPSSVDWYELINTYSAEIAIEDGDVSINSNETTVLATNAETASLNLFNVNCIERIKFGKIELIPYNGGLAIQVSDEEVNNGN